MYTSPRPLSPSSLVGGEINRGRNFYRMHIEFSVGNAEFSYLSRIWLYRFLSRVFSTYLQITATSGKMKTFFIQCASFTHYDSESLTSHISCRSLMPSFFTVVEQRMADKPLILDIGSLLALILSGLRLMALILYFSSQMNGMMSMSLKSNVWVLYANEFSGHDKSKFLRYGPL